MRFSFFQKNGFNMKGLCEYFIELDIFVRKQLHKMFVYGEQTKKWMLYIGHF